jgi:hypothetical protein
MTLLKCKKIQIYFYLLIGSPSDLLLPISTCIQSLVKFWRQLKVETYKLYTTYFFFITELNLCIQHSINNVNKYKYKLYFDNWLET